MQQSYEITITDAQTAEEILLSEAGSTYLHVLSFGDPGRSPPRGLHMPNRKVLRLEFMDVEETSAETSAANLPQTEHVQSVIDFFSNITEPAPRILIHCQAGVSRSTAAGLILLFLFEGDKDAAARRLQAIRPQALPNRLMIRLADQILGTNLIDTCEGIYSLRMAEMLRHIRESSED
ncbi:MAG: dual specificity protein phosphatase family protein [Leptospirales bacterium]|nr:dual specificity protein phosphatase family protein [Leptospirales bacterium]